MMTGDHDVYIKVRVLNDDMRDQDSIMTDLINAVTYAGIPAAFYWED